MFITWAGTIEKVVDARWKDGRGATTNDETLAEDLEFRCHLRGWDQPEREQRIDKLLSKQLLSNGDRTQRQQADAKLMQALLDSEPPILIFFPRNQFPEDTPPSGEDGWWYKARRTGLIRRCGRCWLQKWLDHFPSEMHSAAHTKPECYECQAARNKERLEEETEGPIPGLLSVTADPRLVGRKDDPSGGDIIVDGPGLRYLLGISKSRKAEHMELWLTTRQMGFAVVREEDEIDDPEAEWTGEPTETVPRPASFCLHPDRAGERATKGSGARSSRSTTAARRHMGQGGRAKPVTCPYAGKKLGNAISTAG